MKYLSKLGELFYIGVNFELLLKLKIFQYGYKKKYERVKNPKYWTLKYNFILSKYYMTQMPLFKSEN